MGRVRVYPVFLPQWGCPHQCVYCNQRATTAGAADLWAREEGLASVQDRIDSLAREAGSRGAPGELAFYGGTFTALPAEWIEKLLHGACAHVDGGLFSGIRFSTRPDALPKHVRDLLSRYPIRTVELGAQSLSNEVLQRSRRGYGAGDVVEAVRRVREMGWKLGLQLMSGLPGDSRDRFLDSVRDAVRLAPDFVRIYPTLVLRDTRLAHWQSSGSYAPLSLEEAVEWSAAALELFQAGGIPVIRMGLHPDPELLKPGVILGGPFHPAFGYLVKVRWWRDRVDRWCAERDGVHHGRHVTLKVAREVVSELLGPARENLAHWRIRWGWAHVLVEPMADWPSSRFEVCMETRDAGTAHAGIPQAGEAR